MHVCRNPGANQWSGSRQWLGERRGAEVANHPRSIPRVSAAGLSRPLRHLNLISEEQCIQEQLVRASPVPAEVCVVHKQNDGASAESVGEHRG